MTALTQSAPPPQAATPPAKNRKPMIVGAAVAAVLVIAAAAFFIPLMASVSSEKSTFQAVDTIGDLKRTASPSLNKQNDAKVAELKKEGTLANPFLVQYEAKNDPGKTVQFLGTTQSIWFPSREVSTAFNQFTKVQADALQPAPTNVKEVDPGKLGGSAQCGEGTVRGEGDVVICAFADHGSYATLLFSGFSADEAPALMRSIREATIKRA